MEQDLNSIVPVLSKPPSQRTQEEIEELSEKIKQLALFKSMSKELASDTVEKCASLFRYEFKTEDSYVVQYGDKATRYYIILKGRVGVLVPHRAEDKTVMQEILEMSEGSSFGELGLNENKTRAASIICKEDTHFIYLEKEAYMEVFVNYVRNKQRAIIETLKHNSMFAGFSNIFLVKLSYFFNEEKTKRGTEVFKEGHPADFIYIVKEGEFSLRKKINHCIANQTEKKFSIKKNNSKETEVAIISRGSFCNEEDLLNEEYMLSCKCISMNGIVLSIKKSDLIHKIVGRDSEHTLNSLSLKKLLRKQQAKNIWNVKNGLKIETMNEESVKTNFSSKTLNMMQKRTKDRYNLFSNKGNQLNLLSNKSCLNRVSGPKISKSESLLKYYKHAVNQTPEFSIDKFYKCPNSLSQRDYSSFLIEDCSPRGYMSSRPSISWKHKFCRYIK